MLYYRELNTKLIRTSHTFSISLTASGKSGIGDYDACSNAPSGYRPVFVQITSIGGAQGGSSFMSDAYVVNASTSPFVYFSYYTISTATPVTIGYDIFWMKE